MTEYAPLIDTHIHMWDLTDPTLQYDFLNPEMYHPLMTPEEQKRIGIPINGADQIRAVTQSAGVTSTVHVQCAVGIDDPVKETRWLEQNRLAGEHPTSIVGHVDLAREDAGEQLDRHLAESNVFVGIRDFGHGVEYLNDPAWRKGIAALEARDLLCCLDLSVDRYRLARELTDAFPDCVFVVDHMGMSMRRDEEYFEEWLRELRVFTDAPNVYCKISEQTLVLRSWDPDNALKWMSGCLEVFGPYRCFFGSNWPPDSLHASYLELTNSYRSMTAQLSTDEQNAMNVETAARVFSITR